MTLRRTRVSSDTFVALARPNFRRGQAPELKLNDGAQEALLWAREPWDRQATVSIQTQTLRLTAAADFAGTEDVLARALAEKFVDTEVTWNTKPGVTGVTCTTGVGPFDEGDTVDIDITEIAQAVAAGGRNRGIRLTTTSGTTMRFHSSDSPYRPVVITEWTEQPDPPTIVPSGGKTSRQFPIVKFEYDEADADLTSVRLQIDAAGDTVTPDFDSGQVVTTEALLDTADTAYTGLAAGASTMLRGTITVAGVESDWSEWITLTRRVKGALVIDSPNAGEVTSPTPVILASFTSPNGENLTEQRVRIYDAAQEKVLYDTRRTPATDADDVAADIPLRWKGERILRRKGDATYWVRVDVWGDPERVDAPGDSAAVTEWAEFVVTDAAITAPTALAVTSVDDEPELQLTFTIAPDAPDDIVIAVDDEIVEVLEAVDLNIGGTSYAYAYAGATPDTDVEVKVAKIVDGEMSPWSTPVTASTHVRGVWVVDDARGLRFRLFDVDVENWRFTDQGVLYDPVGSPYKVKILTGQQGMTGELVGTIRDEADLTHDEQIADLWRIKSRPNQTVRLVTGQWSIPVRLDDLGAGPSSQRRLGLRRSLVRFSFRQYGDLPFTTRL